MNMAHQHELRDASGVGKTILLVDDEFAILSLLQDTLEEAGYAVLVAKDGQEALAIAWEHPPDLVLTDIMMPRLDGIELARRLHGDNRTRHIPILAMSAAQRFPQTHTFAFVFAKPFDLDEVIEQVRYWLSMP